MNDINSTHITILNQYPMLSLITHGGNEYIGIIQNTDDVTTSLYDFGVLKTQPQKVEFLRLGEEWWWGSNRKYPINLFLKTDWKQFSLTLKVFNSKDVEIKIGPYVSLKELVIRRGKKRSITLVRKI